MSLTQDDFQVEVDAAILADSFLVVLALEKHVAFVLKLECLLHVLVILRHLSLLLLCRLILGHVFILSVFLRITALLFLILLWFLC